VEGKREKRRGRDGGREGREGKGREWGKGEMEEGGALRIPVRLRLRRPSLTERTVSDAKRQTCVHTAPP